jgi:hypothetical protein
VQGLAVDRHGIPWYTVVTEDVMWKTIPGFPEHYEVSDDGQVRTWLVRGSKKVSDNPTAMVGWFMHGYPAVLLRDVHGKRKCVRVHQAVLLAFVGPCPPGQEARHLDGSRTNNRLDNLKWGTPKENSDDKREHGTMVTGEQTVTAKLQASDVVAIRALLRRGYGLDFIGSMFDISKRMVARIRDGLSWDEVSDRAEIIKQANECPATLGCLLALVREAWGDPYLCCVGDLGTGWRLDGYAAVEDIHGYCSEAKALVAALESAP